MAIRIYLCLTPFIFQPDFLFRPCLGASGAISGIMGVYIYRLYYSKVKPLITPLCFFIPKRIPVNAVAILGYWFLQDLLGAVASLGNPYVRVGFWAHVGGFLVGVLACWLLDYGPEAVRDKNRFIGEKYLQRPVGFGKGIDALEKVLASDPEDADLHLSLARAKSRIRETKEGKEHYEKAIRLLIRRNPGKVAEIYREYWGKYLVTLEPETQLPLTLQLIREGYFDFSAKTLEALIQDFPGDGPFMEKAFLTLARLYGKELDSPRKAANVYEQLFRTFPQSQWREVVLREYEEVIGK